MLWLIYGRINKCMIQTQIISCVVYIWQILLDYIIIYSLMGHCSSCLGNTKPQHNHINHITQFHHPIVAPYTPEINKPTRRPQIAIKEFEVEAQTQVSGPGSTRNSPIDRSPGDWVGGGGKQRGDQKRKKNFKEVNKDFSMMVEVFCEKTIISGINNEGAMPQRLHSFYPGELKVHLRKITA